jgi:hypothetical protein
MDTGELHDLTVKGAVVTQLERCEVACQRLFQNLALLGLELQNSESFTEGVCDSKAASDLGSSVELLENEERALRLCVDRFVLELRQVENLAKTLDGIREEEERILSLEQRSIEQAERCFYLWNDARDMLRGTRLTSIKEVLESAARYPRIPSWTPLPTSN